MSKVLDKVSKLLAKAENAGTPEEAEAFMAKAMEMAAANAIDLAVARMHQAKKEKVQEPEERRIQVNPFNRRHNRKHFVDLGLAIAEVNDCECLIGSNDYTIFAVGFPEDLDVVEALYTHLSVEMVSECDEALKKGANRETRRVRVIERQEIAWEDREWGEWNGKQYYDENPDDSVWKSEGDEGFEAERDRKRAEYLEAVKNNEDTWSPYARTGWRKPVPPPAYREVPVFDADGNPRYEEKEVATVDGRVFRNSFYAAFVSRMRGRLWEIKRSVEKERGTWEESSSTALALRDKKEEVKKADEERRSKVRHLGTYSSALESDRKSDFTGRGRELGRKAAETVPVGTEGRAVKK